MIIKRLLLAIWLFLSTLIVFFAIQPIFTGSSSLVIWLADTFGARGAEDILILVLTLNLLLYLAIISLPTFTALQLKKKFIR